MLRLLKWCSRITPGPSCSPPLLLILILQHIFLLLKATFLEIIILTYFQPTRSFRSFLANLLKMRICRICLSFGTCSTFPGCLLWHWDAPNRQGWVRPKPDAWNSIWQGPKYLDLCLLPPRKLNWSGGGTWGQALWYGIQVSQVITMCHSPTLPPSTQYFFKASMLLYFSKQLFFLILLQRQKDKDRACFHPLAYSPGIQKPRTPATSPIKVAEN